MQFQISWLLHKPTDLDLYALQRQGIYRLSRTRVKISLDIVVYRYAVQNDWNKNKINVIFLFFDEQIHIDGTNINSFDKKYEEHKKDLSMTQTSLHDARIQQSNIIRGMKLTEASIYIYIMKTCLFKYTENFATKKWNFSDKKFWYFSYFCSKHKLWVLNRTASMRRF